jgi:hypothetical protein
MEAGLSSAVATVFGLERANSDEIRVACSTGKPLPLTIAFGND